MATTWLGVGGGEAVYFGHGFVEGDVVPGLVFDGQAVGAGCAAVAVQHGFVGVYGDCGVHGSGMLAGHVDGGHEVGSSQPQSITPSTPTS